jgi:tagatose-1,6-bisphosphate aldolase
MLIVSHGHDCTGLLRMLSVAHVQDAGGGTSGPACWAEVVPLGLGMSEALQQPDMSLRDPSLE